MKFYCSGCDTKYIGITKLLFKFGDEEIDFYSLHCAQQWMRNHVVTIVDF